MQTKTVNTSVLQVTYREYGDADGWPCVMNHGFPFDVHAYADAAPLLAKAGARVIVPYLRGYGPTRFLADDTPRSGEQAALGGDLLELLDALEIDKAVVGGYDWGGRAACVVSALFPERVVALVSGNSYNIQDIARCMEPASAESEAAYWYQYYFHSERGERGLRTNREDITRLLWKMWSPPWDFSEEVFQQSAAAFHNPDFVDVVIHSYRHRYALVDGDPRVAEIEKGLALQPAITVPAITIDGEGNGIRRDTSSHANKFTGPHEHRFFPETGHNIPQEKPEDWVKAVLDARAMANG